MPWPPWTAPSHWRTRPAQVKWVVMRTLRLVLMSTMALALACGSIAVAVGQEPETPGVTTGTFTMIEADETSEMSRDGGRERQQMVLRGPLEMADARLSGTLTLSVDLERVGESQSDPFVLWGASRLENDVGSWTGSLAGVGQEGTGDLPAIELPSWYVGEGAYEGLAAYLHLEASEEVDGNIVFDGHALIYEGRPPVSPGALLPSEGLTAVGPAAVLVEGEFVLDRRDQRLWTRRCHRGHGADRRQEARGLLVLSDQRLTGEADITTNVDSYSTRSDLGASVSWGEMRVRNLGGIGSSTGLAALTRAVATEILAYGEGVDEHDGWSARLKLTTKGGLTGIYDVRGVVFEGELPPLP